ncbi:type V toxin-antitoxin system endoribonuclease antitoxin GhoS [Escherichia coli]|uniref:type V toxin-antitoxin system endoribonuclease antitoxin GhoS n=1 Tax=Escherichia coli TaxID=562 RepID=UPI000BDF8443|nr:type V toxin-antitoxin system endoribonuclease antitoxin GhoS [Escherichia coli]EFD4923471.1 type V toxin-antitoxin system endoribonuclease antitoxin GhoS [Escherichia coli]EGL2090574.1 type V toxin-antitoxin system endoribonuclease antitoxin GhoS [Escherichia coli]EHC9922616.1 type V toxin-antitoxin system endoribonuclease antitoxin GhoS [Escherichia coli]HAL3008909.1 type V toxin-antitoxin system endoribonuclease antitoxin GhoS [Escherichia coli]
MESKNDFNTYIISFNYPLSYFPFFLELKSLMYDMNFASIVIDKNRMLRELDKNTLAITTLLVESEIEDLIRSISSGLSDVEFGLNVMKIDDYFCRIYK